MAIWSTRAGVAHQHAFDDARLPCVSLQVPYVTLGAGLHDGCLTILHDTSQCTHFDGISQSCTCSVQLGAGDLICREPGLAHGAAHALLLRRTVGRRHAGTPAILVQAGTNDCGQRISGDALFASRQKAGGAFATFETICRHVEGEASAIHGQHVGSTKVNIISRAWNHVGSTHQRFADVRVLSRQGLIKGGTTQGGMPHSIGHQSRRAGGVQQGLWSFEAQGETNSPCNARPFPRLISVAMGFCVPGGKAGINAPVVTTVTDVDSHVFASDVLPL
mmetsp:Transcript_78715/g.160053  ORF Transcript_78715/g.160053 Transcript_78715/m.160053 type:complete len:276 (-) Transcript_78715:739-1566(-)